MILSACGMGVLEALSTGFVNLTAPVIEQMEQSTERARQAEALNGRLASVLAALVDAYPQTSWLSSNDALDAARALLEEISGQGGTIDQTPTHEEPA